MMTVDPWPTIRAGVIDGDSMVSGLEASRRSELRGVVLPAVAVAVAAEARATEAITQAQAMDAAARDLANHAASLAAGIHELAVLAAKLKLATLAASFVRALDDLVSSLVPGSDARSTAVSPPAQSSNKTASVTSASVTPTAPPAPVAAMMARTSASVLSDQIKSQVGRAQAELTAAEAKIHEAENATEQTLQADTQAEIAALQAKAASSLAAAQADFNNVNMTYAQIPALDKMAMAHQMPGGDATFVDANGTQKRVDSQTGLYRYVVSGASPKKHH